MSMTKGTPCSSQLILAEQRIEELEHKLERATHMMGLYADAVKYLLAAKGRYHTEQAYKRLEATAKELDSQPRL